MADNNSESAVPFESKRVPFERTIILKFEQFSGFIKEYSANISMGGMFVRTAQLREPGSVFEFAFKLSDDYNLIQGVGEVVWTREEPEEGMGIRFLELDWESRKLIFRLVDQYIQDGGIPFDVEKGPDGLDDEADAVDSELLEALDLEPEDAAEGAEGADEEQDGSAEPSEEASAAAAEDDLLDEVGDDDGGDAVSGGDVESDESAAAADAADDVEVAAASSAFDQLPETDEPEPEIERAGGYRVEDGMAQESAAPRGEEVLLSDLALSDVEMPEPTTESPYPTAGIPASVALSSRDNRSRRALLIGLPLLVALVWGGWWLLESGRARPLTTAEGSATMLADASDVPGSEGEAAEGNDTVTGSGDATDDRPASGSASSTGPTATGADRLTPATSTPAPASTGAPTGGTPAAARDLEAARRQAEGTVRAWASTWANQDVDVYLNFYSSRFSPPAGLSRAAWEAQRRERLTAPRSIEVEVSSLSIEASSLEQAEARFEQSYTSDRYSDVVTKVLILVWEEGQWRILREEIAES